MKNTTKTQAKDFLPSIKNSPKVFAFPETLYQPKQINTSVSADPNPQKWVSMSGFY